MIGDVVGRGGRRALAALLGDLKSEFGIDFVTAQGENAAAGYGLTVKVTRELLNCGVDVITTGNHIWDRKEFIPMLDSGEFPVLRPHNYPVNAPGVGVWESDEIAVVNLIGRAFMRGEVNSCFSAADDLLNGGFGAGKPIIVDFHAEATSEKYALGWFLDGRVAALVGTHTHTPTADARILPQGAAFVADLGMVGATESVLGMGREAALQRFLTGVNARLTPVEKGTMQFNSVLIDIDDQTHKAVSIQRVDREVAI